MLVPAIRAGLRYDAMIDRSARRSPVTHAQIVATLRSFVGSRHRAPFITDLDPLLDTFLHAQD